MIRIAIIGAGNISNTRHIPAVLRNKELSISGAISDDKKKLIRTQQKYHFINNTLLLDSNDDIETILKKLKSTEWFMNETDAVIIGTPPFAHFMMTKVCLLLSKHVLVEKPMMMSVQECDEVCRIADENGLILNVMHSFQFSEGIEKLSKIVEQGQLGEIESILEIQLTNRKRRLPLWYNSLPLGLFYDEAAHFFYSAIRFGGKLKVLNAHAQFGEKAENTPKFLEVQLRAGNIPVQMFMNFNSPICEWGLLLLGTDRIAIYDYFKDILIVLDNDNLHLAKNVLKVSLQFFRRFWKGFISNGFKMVSGRLLYGHDKAIEAFINAIKTGNPDERINKSIGTDVVSAMNEVVRLVEIDVMK